MQSLNIKGKIRMNLITNFITRISFIKSLNINSLIIGLCLLLGKAYAQEQGKVDVSRFVIGSEEQGEVATSVLELDDGGLLIAGYDYNDWNSEWDALILRIGSDGREIWRRSSDRDGNDHAWVVLETANNQFVVVGTRTMESGDTDGYMECFDGDGKSLWLQTYSKGKNEIFWAAEQTTDGGFILAGQTEREGGDLDFYVVRTDSRGNELWSQSFGKKMTDRAFGVDTGPDDSALVVGFQGDNPQNMDVLLLNVDSKGNEKWRRTLPGDKFDVAHDVLSVPDGGFVIAGYTNSFSPGDQDGFLMKLSDEGRLLWLKTYDTASDDRILHVVSTSDNGFAMVGYSRQPNGNIWDMVIRKVNQDGDLLWSHREIGANGKDIFFGQDGSIIAVGGIRKAISSFEDILVVRLNPEKNSDKQ